jgi:hypothetical protein
MSKKKVLINYTNRDFNSIKSDLEEHARLYYPDSFKDFSENSFGSYVIDTVAYVGDMLSFYLDYQVNESFLETALEYENVKKLSKYAGYDYYSRPPAYGTCAFYVVVPANTSGLGPDRRYLPILNVGSEFKSQNGDTFVLTEDVDFSNSKNEVVASTFSNTTGKPTNYAVRAYGQVKSIVSYRLSVDVGSFSRFLRIRVGPSSVSEIKSVRDTEGHEYYEVDSLSQDVIYVNTTNPQAQSDGVPQIIKPRIVPRRFVVERDENGTYLQFGYGSDEEIVVTDVMDPSQASLKMSGRPYISDQSFDPTKLLDSNTLGVAPANTTLTIRYCNNDSESINVAAGALNIVSIPLLSFPNDDGLMTTSLISDIRSSIEVSNEQSIASNTSLPSSEEIRIRTYASKASQARAVTRNDYEAYCYLMPSYYGSIKRASIVNDPSSTNRRLSLYVVSENNSRKLVESNGTIKQNLKQWLNKNKMLNDNIDIYNAKIINLGFDYKVIVDPTRDKREVLNDINIKLRRELSEKMYIAEPFYLTKVFNIINKVDGVVDTIKVTPNLKLGSNYSNPPITIEDVKSKDGT